MPVTLEPGVVGKTACAPLFRPPTEHYILIYQRNVSGQLSIAWFSHSWDPTEDTVVQITRQNLPSAYPPLQSDLHALILGCRGRMTICADIHEKGLIWRDPRTSTQILIPIIEGSLKKTDPKEWENLQWRIMKAAKWVDQQAYPALRGI